MSARDNDLPTQTPPVRDTVVERPHESARQALELRPLAPATGMARPGMSLPLRAELSSVLTLGALPSNALVLVSQGVEPVHCLLVRPSADVDT
jgi:hypothetical protein